MQWWADPNNYNEYWANRTDKEIEEEDYIKLKNQGRIGWYYPGTDKLKEFGITQDNGLLKIYNVQTEAGYKQEMWINNYNAVCNGGLINFLIAFANTVGRVERKISLSGRRRQARARIAPIKVASVPNIISSGTTPVAIILEIKQPTVSPKTASGINRGKMQSASEILN